MERSYNLNLKTRLLTKNTYLETHHFPNLNPVKRSLAEPSPSSDKLAPFEFLNSRDSANNLLRSQSKNPNFGDVGVKNFTFESEDNNETRTAEGVSLRELQEENQKLKEGFIEKEKAYIREIETISQEILAIKEKYKKFEDKIEKIVEEKNLTIEKLKAESKSLSKKTEDSFTSFKTFQKEGRVKELEKINEKLEMENRQLFQKNKALEMNFLLVSIENQRILEETGNGNVWKKKYEDLEVSHLVEIENFKRNIEDLKGKKLELEVSEKVAEATHQKSQEIYKLRLELKDSIDRNEQLQKELNKLKTSIFRSSKENLALREINL